MLVDRIPVLQSGHLIGSGVNVSRINRIASATVDASLIDISATIGNVQSSLGIATRIGTILSPESGSVSARLQSFFTKAQDLQARPEDSVERQNLIHLAESLALEFNNSSKSLERLRIDTIGEVDHVVNSLNQKLEALFETNRQIAVAEASGLQPNDLLDRHQIQVEEISGIIGIRAQKSATGFEYQIANYSINQTDVAIRHEFDAQGRLTLTTDSGFPIEPESGALAGYQQYLNSTLPNTLDELDQLALEFMKHVDQVHATGLGNNGGFSVLSGQRSVTDVDALISDSAVPFQVSSGELYFSVTNTTTGERSLSSIQIDPATQSLRDIASSISSLANVQAVVNSDNNNLTIIAEPGFEFDFAGRLPTSPDRTLITGDAPISFSGQYEGEHNGQYTFEIEGSGQVGIDDDLFVKVTNENGEQVGTYAIGAGYEPGSEIELKDGVKVRFDSGTLNDLDLFEVDLVQNPDTSNVLSALGLNSLFTGDSAASIAVDSRIANDPDSLSLSRNGDLGDGQNAERIFELRDLPVFNGQRTFSEQFTLQQTENGIEVNRLLSQQQFNDQAMNRLLGERQAISGVDPNEELVRMIQFQESFQASVRVIQVADEMMAELMRVVG